MYKKNIKKIGLFFIIISPLVFVFLIGYPIIYAGSDWSSLHPFSTQRCFNIGNLESYLNCLKDPYPKLRGVWLMRLILLRLTYIHPFLNYLFIGTLSVSLLVVFLLI